LWWTSFSPAGTGMTRGSWYPMQLRKGSSSNNWPKALLTYHLEMTTLIWCILRTRKQSFQMERGVVDGVNLDSRWFITLAILGDNFSRIDKSLWERHKPAISLLTLRNRASMMFWISKRNQHWTRPTTTATLSHSHMSMVNCVWSVAPITNVSKRRKIWSQYRAHDLIMTIFYINWAGR
jgi:hypothetical protein